MHPDTHKKASARCAVLGLSLAQVQRFAGFDHSWSDLACMVGLDPETIGPVEAASLVVGAAQTCSVSYRKPLTPDELMDVLATGNLASDDVSTFFHFLDEAPLPLAMKSEFAENLMGIP